MLATIREAWLRRAVIAHFVSLHLTTSYRTKALGFLWALLDPLLFMGVYYLVFGYLIAQRPPEFMIHIFVGVISFRFLNRSMSQGASVLRSQSATIKEIKFPKVALPFSVVIARIFDFVAGWIIAIPLAFVFGVEPNAAWLVLPVLMLIQAVFVTGFTLITAYVGVFFADIENILDVGLRLWFYLSPVLYPISVVQDKIDKLDQPILMQIYLLNPMVHVLQAYEAPVVESRLPDASFVLGAAVSALVAFTLGLFVFTRAEGQMAKYV